MSFTFVPIPLFSEENFSHCIVVSFPEGGKIVDTVSIDKTAYLIVESTPGAKVIPAHFHIIPMLEKLYADGYEYIGTYKIQDFLGQPLVMLSVIRITAGDYGIHSQEFIDIFGTEERDRILKAYQEAQLSPPEIISPPVNLDDVPGITDNDETLRKLWDFTGGSDKTNDDENPETNIES